MKKNKETYIYETHDTPFGSYTLRFKDNNNVVLKRRGLAFLNGIDKISDDLKYYEIKSGKGFFEAIPDKDRRMLEHLEIVEKKEVEPEKVAKPRESFLFLLEHLETPLMDGYFYNEEKDKGVLMFNGTSINIYYTEHFWSLFWNGERDYSLGVLKECLYELEQNIDLGALRLEWEFDKECRNCKVFFVKE